MKKNNNIELTLQEIQQGSFQVLKRIKEIFDKNGWKYFLTAGTLIGAVRHKGFIPWDDDIDIWVPRPDYEKFINYCIENREKLLPFELIHYKTNDKYIYPIARFSDSRYRIDYNNTRDYGLGLFVDIYPLDGIKGNYKFLKSKFNFINKIVFMCGQKNMVYGKNKVKNFLKIPIFHLLKHINLNRLLRKEDRMSQRRSFEESNTVECICWTDRFVTYKKEWIIGDTEKYMEFNGEKFRVPYDYHTVLTRLYGDYMKIPPKKEQVAHHFYKAYKK